MSAGAAWESIVRAALLGTERQQGTEDAATGDAALDGAVAALADRPAEERLLGSAALLDAWRRAGQRASRTSAAPPAPAPEVEERPCSPLAARVLRQLLAGAPPPLLGEWLSLAERAGAAIPHELLPGVLDFARRHAEVREEVARTLGPRGRWLAARNPAWSYAAGPAADDPAEAWESGTADERARILRRVRRTDPGAGLALLRSTWEANAPRDRVLFLEELSVGLGMDDEPFLESVLDDRRREVRVAAARRLAGIPGSRYVQRMVDRLMPLLRLHAPEGLLARLRTGRARIDVELPAACDKAMERDGIQLKPPQGTGERAWWLQQMIPAVPPSVWAAHWGVDAATLLDAARAGEHGMTLIRGWTVANVRNPDPEWAEALLRTQVGAEGLSAVADLAGALPPGRLEPLAIDRLREGRLSSNEPAALVLEAARFPWSPGLTRAVLASIPVPLPPFDYALRERLRTYALHMHPSAAIAALREQGDPHEGPWIDLLHLRHTLHQAFE